MKDYLKNYTPAETKAALDKLLAALDLDAGVCPRCGAGELEEQEPAPAEPCLGLSQYRGGVWRRSCGWQRESPDTTPDPMTEAKWLADKETGDADDEQIAELRRRERRWHCPRCDTLYAEYVNGCPRCAAEDVVLSVRQSAVVSGYELSALLSAHDDAVRLREDVSQWQRAWIGRAEASEWRDALHRSPYDISLCMECGKPVVCIPDGMPMCEPCGAALRPAEQGGGE